MKKKPWSLLGKLEQHKANKSAGLMLSTQLLIAKTNQQRGGLSSALDNYAVKGDATIPIALLKNHLLFRSKLLSAIKEMDTNLESLNLKLLLERNTWLAQQAKADGFEKLHAAHIGHELAKLDKAEQASLDELGQKGRKVG